MRRQVALVNIHRGGFTRLPRARSRPLAPPRAVGLRRDSRRRVPQAPYELPQPHVLPRELLRDVPPPDRREPAQSALLPRAFLLGERGGEPELFEVPIRAVRRRSPGVAPVGSLPFTQRRRVRSPTSFAERRGDAVGDGPVPLRLPRVQRRGRRELRKAKVFREGGGGDGARRLDARAAQARADVGHHRVPRAWVRECEVFDLQADGGDEFRHRPGLKPRAGDFVFGRFDGDDGVGDEVRRARPCRGALHARRRILRRGVHPPWCRGRARVMQRLEQQLRQRRGRPGSDGGAGCRRGHVLDARDDEVRGVLTRGQRAHHRGSHVRVPLPGLERGRECGDRSRRGNVGETHRRRRGGRRSRRRVRRIR